MRLKNWSWELHMGRFRNPRYAPEALEGRLSPSVMMVTNPAEYSRPAPTEPPPPAYGSPTSPSYAPNPAYPSYPA